MSNNSLPCPDCKGHHHPMSCPLELSKLQKPKLQPHKMGCKGKEDKRYCDCGAVLLNNLREEYDQWIINELEPLRDNPCLSPGGNADEIDTIIQKIKES